MNKFKHHYVILAGDTPIIINDQVLCPPNCSAHIFSTDNLYKTIDKAIKNANERALEEIGAGKGSAWFSIHKIAETYAGSIGNVQAVSFVSYP